MQDVNAAIAELERIMVYLEFKGAMINDHVNGQSLDAPEFLPFWKAAEQLVALILFQQGGNGRQLTHSALPSAQYRWQSGRACPDVCLAGVWRRHGCLPGSQDLSGAWWWLHLSGHGAPGSQLAQSTRDPAAHQP